MTHYVSVEELNKSATMIFPTQFKLRQYFAWCWPTSFACFVYHIHACLHFLILLFVSQYSNLAIWPLSKWAIWVQDWKWDNLRAVFICTESIINITNPISSLFTSQIKSWLRAAMRREAMICCT